MDYRNFLELAYSLVRIRDLDKLLDTILSRLRIMLNCDAGSIFIYNEDTDELTFKYTQNDTMELPFKEFSIPVNKSSIAGYVALTKKMIMVSDVYKLDRNYPFQFNKTFDRMSGYRTKSMLVFPILDINGTITGVLQFINKKRQPLPVTPENASRVVMAFNKDDEVLAKSMIGIVSLALENGMLYDKMEKMWEGFITTTSQAIESRLPGGRGHTSRVETLSLILADEMTKDEEVFPDFQLDVDERKKLRYACILHDYGKIAVREAVLQKYTKLSEPEMEVISYRFKLVKTQLKAKGASQEDIDKLTGIWDNVSMANIPDRLTSNMAAALKKAHNFRFKDIDGQDQRLLTDDEYEYLMVDNGVHTDQDKAEIEEHARHTYEFLNAVPWVKNLADLPEITAMHHENISGDGYPFGLSGDEIHIYGKIMAVVDSFDTLAAKTGTYKKPVPVDEACELLKQQAKDGKLDKDIVDFFVDRHIYRRV